MARATDMCEHNVMEGACTKGCSATMPVPTSPIAEQKYKYKGTVVSIIGESGGLREVMPEGATDGAASFWVRAEKLKPIKPKKVHRHSLPNLSGDPFVSWLLLQRVTIYADCPPAMLTRFALAYLEATGECLNREEPHLTVADADKSWSYSLYITFPQPPANMKLPCPTYRNERGHRLTISNNEFVLGLLALGLRFGSNQPLPAA